MDSKDEPIETTTVYSIYYFVSIYVFLTFTSVSQMRVSSGLGYIFAILGYMILFAVLFQSRRLSVKGNNVVILSITLMSFLLTVPILLSPTVSNLLRIGVFIPIIIINMFIIPNVVPRYIFYTTLSRLTAIFTILGFPAIITGTFGPIPSFHITYNLFGSSVSVHGLTFFFNNPNEMGAMGAFGTLAAAWEYMSTKSKLSIAIIIINSLGVYFSQSRAAGLALLIGTGIIFIFWLFGRYSVITATIAGVILAPTITLIKFGVIPGPNFIYNIDLNNRVQLWKAAYQALLDRPFFGWGVGDVPEAMVPYITAPHLENYGPHNSYVRMFAATGIIGGLNYIFIYIYMCIRRAVSSYNSVDAAELGIVISVLVIHTFSGISLFGLAFTSIIASIVLGYAQLRFYKSQNRTSVPHKAG